MPLSTSNSDPARAAEWPETYWERPIPTAHWRGVALLTFLLVSAFLFSWETCWRLQGYEPAYADTPELWSRQRERAGTGERDEVVSTGSSRIQFNLDPDAWVQDFGGRRPVSLARVGTNPRPFLSDLARDENFRGLLLVGITEGLFFAPDPSPPTREALQFLEHHANRPLSARADHLLSIPLHSAFAFLNAEDLSLSPLLRRRWLSVADRENAYIMPNLPPYMGRIDSERRIHMWSRMERDRDLQQEVQNIWLPLFQLGPPLGGEPLAALIDSVRRDVEKIRARGGEVVFIRYPSTGRLYEIETVRWPREAYWDRLIEETGAHGIHFEDHEALRGFNCPEWSHLTRVDAVTFTRNLVPIIRERTAR